MNKGVQAVICGLVVALSLAAFGCGSGDDATASVSRDEFLAKGNAICKEAAVERGNALRKFESEAVPGKVLSKKEREEFVVGVFIPPYRKAITELEGLGAPAGDEDEVAAIIEAMEEAADDVEAEPLVGLRSVKQFYRANELTKKYGLTECAV